MCLRALESVVGTGGAVAPGFMSLSSEVGHERLGDASAGSVGLFSFNLSQIFHSVSARNSFVDANSANHDSRCSSLSAWLTDSESGSIRVRATTGKEMREVCAN